MHSQSSASNSQTGSNPAMTPAQDGSSLPVPPTQFTVESKLLGSGNSSNVYKGILGGKPVAVKVANTANIKGLLKEAKNHSKIGSHPNIIQLYTVCLVTEEAKETLANYLTTHPELSVAARIKLLSELISGLQYLENERRILHMDLAWDNILVDQEGHIKIADFGMIEENCEDFSEHVIFVLNFITKLFEKDLNIQQADVQKVKALHDSLSKSKMESLLCISDNLEFVPEYDEEPLEPASPKEEGSKKRKRGTESESSPSKSAKTEAETETHGSLFRRSQSPKKSSTTDVKVDQVNKGPYF